MRLLKLKVNGLLVDFAYQLQGLVILHLETDGNVKAEDELVSQMGNYIENPLFLGPCKSIEIWS